MKPSPQFANKNKGFTLIELMIVVAIVGILAVLAVVGVRRYLANAKSAEARNALGAIGKGAAMVYEKGSGTSAVIAPSASDDVGNHCLCFSATAPVPAVITNISGKKYQSNNTLGADFHAGDALEHSGFACLKFEMLNPQAYQYNYTSDSAWAAGPGCTGSTITATAIGNLNGDSVYSTFRLTGAVQSKALTLAPSIEETNPDE